MTSPNLSRLFSLFALIACFSIQVECRSKRMIEGDVVESDKFSYTVYVKSTGKGLTETCTGGILSRRLILTAARCVIDEKTNEFAHRRIAVIAASNDINGVFHGVEIPVEVVMVPRSYNKLEGDGSDIALLRLKEPLDIYHNIVSLLSLPTTKVTDLKDPRFVVAGFGRTDRIGLGNREYGHNKEIDGKLRSANARLDKSCHGWERSQVPNTSFCAKVIITHRYDKAGPCMGDYGAPLVQGTTVYGVVSVVHRSCNDDVVSTRYANVFDFKAFIEDALSGKTPGRSKVADTAGYF